MTKEKTIIELMKDSDNDAILELSHRCPQHGVISGYPDRSPEFNRIHKLISNDSYHMVARKGSKLVGAFGVVYTNLKYRDQEFNSAYLMDLKVDPEFQRSTLAYRLIKKTVDHMLEKGTNMAIATFLKNNEYSLIFTRNRADMPVARYLGDFRIFSIVPLFKKKVSGKFEIGHPDAADIPALVNLYNSFYSKYKLAPGMTEGILKYYTENIEGMGLEQIWVARSDKQIKAVVCAWEEDHYKCWQVERMNLPMKTISFLLRALGLVMKVPAPLREKSSFKHISLVLSAHDNCVEGVADILRTINNYYRGRDYTILQTHFNARDPVNTALKGLMGFAVNAEVHIFTKEKELAENIAAGEGLVHFEWPMFI